MKLMDLYAVAPNLRAIVKVLNLMKHNGSATYHMRIYKPGKTSVASLFLSDHGFCLQI